ncbi:DoxX family protein [Marivita sp.]|uniref:DoxX family protein n=1 Tax=Marivita sp. TaxID=2003365 RepID=UPI0025BCB0C6|nr:DoxX family protein [Marivita sp.]
MDRIVSLYSEIFTSLERALDGVIPLLARFVFAATLLIYFWSSAMTKLGDGLTGLVLPSDGAYAQIFPQQMDAVVYDVSQLSVFHWLVVVAGTWAEFILPMLIVIGLFTRLAALGMIGFVSVQSLTDLYGHGGIAHAETLGAWFDRVPDSAILDQRAFWMFLFVTLVIKGAGALSIDRILSRQVFGTSVRPA